MAKKRSADGSQRGLDDTQSVWKSQPAAVYGLEHPICCPGCSSEIGELYAVRMFRARVNFMSSLPRSGRLLVCPMCRTPVPADIGAVL